MERSLGLEVGRVATCVELAVEGGGLRVFVVFFGQVGACMGTYNQVGEARGCIGLMMAGQGSSNGLVGGAD